MSARILRAVVPSAAAPLVFLLLVPLAGCGPRVPLPEMIEATDVQTGWFDAGVVDGRNKLVPSVSFRLRTTGDYDVRTVALNIAFKFIGPDGEIEQDMDDVYVQSVKFDGNTTPPIVIRSDTGYTGEPPQTRADMLKHTQFRDVRAIIYVRHQAAQWAELTRVDIERQLLTQ